MSWLSEISNTQNAIDQKRIGVIQDLANLKFWPRLRDQLANDVGLINQIWNKRLRGMTFSKFLGDHHFKAERGGSLAVSVELIKDYLSVIYVGEGMPKNCRIPLVCKIEDPNNRNSVYIASVLLPEDDPTLNDVERFSKFILEPITRALNNWPLPELDDETR